MKTKIALLILFISGNLFSQEQKMSDAEIATFKQDVNVDSKKIKTLSTDFVQYKHLDFLSKDIETSGKILRLLKAEFPPTPKRSFYLGYSDCKSLPRKESKNTAE